MRGHIGWGNILLDVNDRTEKEEPDEDEQHDSRIDMEDDEE